MADFNVRSDSVNVEQIMEQIRARIREKRGVDYTEQQIRELAAVKLEKFLDPRGVRSDLLDQFRSAQPALHAAGAAELSRSKTQTLFESHRGAAPVHPRAAAADPQAVLQPEPADSGAAHPVAAEHRSTPSARRGGKRRAAAMDQLYYEVMHNLVVETTRMGIEVKNLKMRVESLAEPARVQRAARARARERRRLQAGGRRASRPPPRRGRCASRQPPRTADAACRGRCRRRAPAVESAPPAADGRSPAAGGAPKGPGSAAAGAGDGADAAAARSAAAVMGAAIRRPKAPTGEPAGDGGSTTASTATPTATSRGLPAATRPRRARPDRSERGPTRPQPSAADPAEQSAAVRRRSRRSRPASAVKLAVVVQRYGQAINGGAELHARYIAEHLARHAEVEVLTTCATDYVTWRNELPPGVEQVNGVPVRRFRGQARARSAGCSAGGPSACFEQPHSLADELDWLDAEGPTSPALIDHLAKHAGRLRLLPRSSAIATTTRITACARSRSRAILVPTAERDSAIGLSIFQPMFRGVRALMYNSPEERAMIQARRRQPGRARRGRRRRLGSARQPAAGTVPPEVQHPRAVRGLRRPHRREQGLQGAVRVLPGLPARCMPAGCRSC